MDFPSLVNLGASLVTIVGTTLTIAQALRHKPSTYQQVGNALPGYTPHPTSHGAAPRRASISALQGWQSIVRTGIGYGVGLSIAFSIVVFSATWLLDIVGWTSGFTPQGAALVFVTLAAMLSLFIAAGLVPARRIGSAAAGLLAGVILAVACDVSTAVTAIQSSPGLTFADQMSEGIVPSLIGLTVSVIFAFVGRWAYYRAASRGKAAAWSSAQ